MNLKAWIISLDSANPTAIELQNTLIEGGISAEITPAVDGRKSMPSLEAGEVISQNKAKAYRRAPLTPSEIGCYLSHLRLIKKAYADGLSHIAIFEDDVVAEPGLSDALKAIINLDESYHFVRLMSLKIRKRKLLQPLFGDYRLVRPVRGAVGTQGYVVNRKGMQIIIAHSCPIYMPIDKFYDSFFLFGLKCFSVEPHAIFELNRTSNISKNKNGKENSLRVFCVWQASRMYRSVWKRMHYIRNFWEFYPAGKVEGRVGRSERMR